MGILTVTESIITDILDHAKITPLREACGFLLEKDGKEFIFPCANVAEEVTYTNSEGLVVTEDLGERLFALDAAAQVAASLKGKILAIFHTHPLTSAEPSEADRQGCKNSKLPWLIVALDGSYTVVNPDDPIPEVPLLGREFVWGVYDCYALLSDYYKREFNITLPRYDRGLLFSWELGNWNKFENSFQDAGFFPLPKGSPLLKGDVILMNLNSNVINHCAVVADPERNIIYHHVLDRKSEASIYGGWYRDITRYVLRHKSN